jgi:hypothetical protein
MIRLPQPMMLRDGPFPARAAELVPISTCRQAPRRTTFSAWSIV